MRVSELALDLGVKADALLHLLREMGIPVGDKSAVVSDADMSKVLARMERERRAGHESPTEAMAAAIEDSQTAPRRRRRRRAEPKPEPQEETVAEEAADDGEAVAADGEAVAADAEPVVEEAEPEASTEEAEPEAAEPAEDPVVAAEAEEAPEPEPEPEPETELVAEAPEPEAEVAPDSSAEAEPAAPPAPKPASVRDMVGDAKPVRRVSQEAAASMRKPAPAASAAPGGQVRIQAEGYTSDGRREGAGKKKGKKRGRVDKEAVQSNIQRVMAEIKGGGGGKKRRKSRQAAQAREEREQAAEEARQEAEREAQIVKVNEFLTVAELAELVDVSSTEIIGSAFKNLGMMVTINQRLDFDQIELLLDEFGMTAIKETEYVGEGEEVEEEEELAEDLKPRPPVVTVMGHVDHGKTLLLDSVRKTNVVAGEAGGITQHIGAYHVELADGRTISFLDTPGHAAFTAMRARGADVTDIVILMVAADDSVMPQTIEAISHAKNAGVPLIVAVNKIDLPAANPGKVKQELLQHDVTLEDFGGDVLSAEISAKTGQGIDDLLDKVLLQAELLELKANPDRPAQGTVIEAKLDVGKGPVTTVLIQKGTLSVGDSFVVGNYDGRVRALLDERGHPVESVGPSIPVQVLGAGGVPQAGDTFQAMDADKAAEIASTRQRLEREKQLRIRERGFKLGDFSKLRAEGQVSTLPLIIKGDVDGSVQALSDALQQLGTDEVQVDIIHRAVGAINEEDVLLAGTGRAVIIGFRVRPHPHARQLAERDEIDYHVYDVIYDAVDQVRSALEGMLAPERREKIHGAAEVREVFKITKVGTIAGSHVIEGVIDRKGHARLIRDGIVVYDGEIGSLKRFKDDAKEVREGFECGIGIANFNDVKVGDIIECYTVEEVARTLAGAS